MQRRSSPSIAPPCSCYPIPHSQIAIPHASHANPASIFSQKG
jgi:hypothetical protein